MTIPNFIEVYNNVFDDNFCSSVIDVFQKSQSLNICQNRQDVDSNESKLQKDDYAMFLPQDLPLDHTNKYIYSEFQKQFWNQCYQEYANKYNILKECASHTCYTIKIQRTNPGQGYHLWHSETSSRESSNRLLVWTAYLNDDFEAGETEFLYQQYRYKPKQGDVIIFPAAYTHTHRGNPPIGGDKYIITGWVEF